jgi:pimeloyl-ACP methyl ester carboxylesterase
MRYVRVGTVGAPPLLVLPGLESHAQPPDRLGRRMVAGSLRPLARGRDVWWVDRRTGLTPGVTIADLADDYAGGLARRHAGPVDLLGTSTGGSIALQLAVDHPHLVRRLVLVSAAARLGPGGRVSQRRVAQALVAGRPRAAGAAMASLLGTPLSDPLWLALGWLLGPLLFRRGRPDLVATIAAEDAFDLTARLPEVVAPVLVVAGDSDGCYSPELFTATATGVPDGRLVVYPCTGHGGVETRRRFGPDVLGFLDGRPDDDRPAGAARPPHG